ncbi:anti-sigma-D factor RsdA [Pseudonocardia sichuanensis]
MPDRTFGAGGGPFDGGRSPRSRPHNGTNGARHHGSTAHPVPFDDLAEPVDLVAVQADDELINALAAGMSVSSPGVGGYDADDRVAAILAAWKADVDAEPVPELVDVDTAVATVVAARPPSSRARHLVPVAAAAAFLVLVIGGVSVSSYNAQPEDALWGVSKVLYSERAESVEAASRVEDRIAAAKAALVAGQPVLAAQELARAQEDLAAVRPQEGQDGLAETQEFLQAKAAETPPGQSADPASPLSTQPSRPVPQGAREPVDPSESDTSTGSGDEESTSGTSRPESDRGPDVAGTPDGDTSAPDSSTRPTNDPRHAQLAPESGDGTTTSRPQPDGHGEGEPDDPTGSTPPSATNEGRPDPTTTSTTPPPPPPSSDGGGGAAPSDRPTASGSEPPPAGG